MDKGFENLKKIYLETKPPMEIGEGYAEVLTRLDNIEPNPIIHFRYIAMGLVTLIVAIGATFLFFPESKAATALKAASQRAIGVFVQPTTTPTPVQKIEQLQMRKPKLSPTSSPTSKQERPTSAPSTTVSEQKSPNNPTNNDEKVKGVSTMKKPTTAPIISQPSSDNLRGNSEEHRNENAQKNENSTSNPSTEKSNGKNK